MQVFQTNSSTRWNRFRWTLLFVLLGIIFAITVLIVALKQVYTPALPNLNNHTAQLTNGLPDNHEVPISKKWAPGFEKYIRRKEKRAAEKKAALLAPTAPKYQLPPAYASFNRFPCGIRSAFYVAWDPQSFYSLQRNISNLNLVIPEWMFIDPKADTITTQVDDRALAIMKKSGVPIMPILSNNYKTEFLGEPVHRILTNPAKKEKLINDVINILEKNHFIGVNVDFEELKESSDEPLVAFQKELYIRLHAKGLLVTQDISPFNEDYNYEELAKYNDYIFLMAYDQYADNTGPGPIAHQQWIESAVDKVARKIPSNKLILALAAYGYDWPQHGHATNITYQQALSTARESEGVIDFDNNSYNLHYSYYDDDDKPHQVYFMDAATTFNSLRFATEYGMAGTALWRLGSEDSRIWKFYSLDMQKAALAKFDFNKFIRVQSSNDVDYMGEGEILDILSTPVDGRIRPEIDSTDMLISEEHYDSLPSMFVVKKYGTADPKKLVLTFDDGPDPTWTPKVLDILKKENVPAAFFVVGINAENNIPIVKRLYKEGYELGNHTFTHPNVADISPKRALLEIESTRLLLECITGHSTILFRAPYNADFEPEKMEELLPVAIARTKNYLDVGESVDPLDWEPGVTADSIVARTIKRKQDLTAAGLSGNVILLHDAGGDTRSETIKALPRIIEYFKSRGYQFTTIADLLGKKKAELMPAVPKGKDYYLVQLNYLLAESGYWGGKILFSLFVVFIVLSMARLAFMAYLATRQRRKEKLTVWPNITDYPLVSIIVPAYNEAVNAVNSVNNLLKTNWPNTEIIFVDDGSKDGTYEKVHDAFQHHNRVKVFTKPNGGKASALNFGIKESTAEYVICIDADTHLHPDAISKMMRHLAPSQPPPMGEEFGSTQLLHSKAEAFSREVSSPPSTGGGRGEATVGAVAGNVKVGNLVNMLTRWQSIEYITSQNFDRKAFAWLNAITVVPGAIGAFRKKAIEDAGGFTTDTLAEDCDLSVRILRQGYTIANEHEALAFTEAPESVAMFIKQRFRWSFGVMQTFWKHRQVLFNKEYKALGWAAFPNILLFQFIIPAFAPVADIFMLIGILTGNAGHILLYYGLFMLVDVAVSVLAFHFEKEKKVRLLWLLPQRLIYRWLMLVVLFKAFLKAIKGELQGWGVLKRTGRVQGAKEALTVA
ncbi:glycosyl transferase family 2 [Niastella yeongjuensis]|uniref:Glycosyl transferase family 2 n=1 Tax=Niastella yeongjuensis TaxID=354355 RepID=A0A1V9E1H5_9BACT|nr:polysaccharide deacetylase family protein [Niastella yeongjuensis]OQP39745.1 glycosyl transferase family 2 [Niastella yeongjuensis]SEO03830.1 Glycosyltransferase, catalytic subunit of cellulose synthase and poly-beta-1,6-N-acetylglucosamine synthase [Niastella yeongjuensis]